MSWEALVAILGLVSGLAGAYASVRRLPGQRSIDAAQRDSLISAAAAQVVEVTRGELHHCRDECERLRRRLEAAERRAEKLERRVGQLEGAMRVAGCRFHGRPGNKRS